MYSGELAYCSQDDKITCKAETNREIMEDFFQNMIKEYKGDINLTTLSPASTTERIQFMYSGKLQLKYCLENIKGN